ncbi:MAG: GNAT family N-acetyltransferase [Candidatus Hermodarchaeota archaeon]
MIQVTKADPERDSEDIARLIQICREEGKTVLDKYTAQEEEIYIKNLLPRDAIFVARQKGKIFAGFASINQRFHYSERLKHCGEVGTWIIPEFRRQGVGSSLWEKGIIPWCHKMGFKHLGFSIIAQNKEGIAFYEQLGFRVCGYHRKLILGYDGKYIDALEMELWIS